MNTSPEQRDACQRLLDGVSRRELNAFGIRAIQEDRQRSPDESPIGVNAHFGKSFLAILADESGQEAAPENTKECFYYDQRERWMQPVVEFLWWLVRTGRPTPVYGTDGSGRITALWLTPLGTRLLDVNHPLTPGFLQRLQARCADLPDAITTHLSDARECLSHGLLRPATVLLGLAYETAVEHAIERLVTDNLVTADARSARAARRIIHARNALARLELDREDGFRLGAALDFADQLRRRRNDGSHTTPTFPFDDPDEIEELIVSAGRHLPGLWLLLTAPPRAP